MPALHASAISRRSITRTEIESYAQAMLHIARSSIAKQLIFSVFELSLPMACTLPKKGPRHVPLAAPEQVSQSPRPICILAEAWIKARGQTGTEGNSVVQIGGNLVINRTATKELSLEIPLNLLAVTDELVQ